MTTHNFFDKFWIPYLEYEAALGYSSLQLRAEIDDLGIKTGDRVINVGINWGESLVYLTERFPDTRQIIGVDSSTSMIELSTKVLSYEKVSPTLKRSISEKAGQFLDHLQKRSRQYQKEISLYHCSAENLDSLGLKADKIAATMGLHWLTKPEKAFTAFNRSLEMNGVVTFSTASSRFEVAQSALLFHQNPYYQHFLISFANLYNATYRPKQEITKPKTFERKSLRDVINLVERNGFTLEQYRELPISISENEIDEVCIAGIKFRYDLDGRDETIIELTTKALQKAKRKTNYTSSIQQYEISPIFKIRKVREA